MRIGIPKEKNDSRVALVPATITKLREIGFEVIVEKGAGIEASFTDEEYSEVALSGDRNEVLKSDIIISINPLPDDELKSLAKDTFVISSFEPFSDDKVIEKLKGFGLRAFSLDMIPRSTIAQSMDVLSSMASIAGYKAVLEAAMRLPRYFPMMVTAAGNIKPAKVIVLGAGVAGLQAIATARRLGAQVEASDVRAAAKEEIMSLGAKFIEVQGAADDKGAGGYAVEQTAEFLQKQQEEVQRRAAKADVIITTAQVRGRKAPVLLPKTTVEQMRKGAVIVDLAASTGGNCELTQNGKVIDHNGVIIVGNSALANTMPQDASSMFSTNIFNFLKYMSKDGQLNLNTEDEIIGGSLITK